MRPLFHALKPTPAATFLVSALFAISTFTPVTAADPIVRITPLPALTIEGRPARAHTQGLESIGSDLLVTARRDDIQPKRALLLRLRSGSTTWDSWDITVSQGAGTPEALDHPGGFQSDGTRLWIPLAQSARHGHSRIRVYALDTLKPGITPTPEIEFPVDDHIGAIAVSRDTGQVLGASWDTECVYVWDLSGRLERRLTVPELRARKLGMTRSPESRSGLAVQDWKFVGPRLLASGLHKESSGVHPVPQSRLIWFDSFLEPEVHTTIISLPRVGAVEPGHEGMAVSGAEILFLPEDLGATNRLLRVPLQ